MIAGKTVLAMIPARGGSKAVPHKNIRDVGGKPLIAWTIEEAKKSKYIDRLILSSDDNEIIRVANQWGCEVPFVRPSELAQDTTPGIDPVLHAMETLPEKYDYVVLLQPTSPLRTVDDIDSCIERCLEKQANACVTVTCPDKSPYWMYELDRQERLVPILDKGSAISRRQDLPSVYVLNGAVYVANCEWLLKNRTFLSGETVACLMPKERSWDIDSETDLQMVGWMISRQVGM
ncbi:acylneuraminate cytidylyltransferase family protein [Effusibacillus dendaii]|uniref:Acylneuraminate cytidylyltransferase n=1 Tax=Effusibacillus dendaii TaxID=2743772 RepID=A0A7I8DCR3_9BACL|nr:acylneuraminate cytidylyltransferase family protein [Effusibacillus dendaii]BCJ87884.1 hypothetical protein skT53_28690 [Effusibacillus dendaii]